jgi:hypothetical protein
MHRTFATSSRLIMLGERSDSEPAGKYAYNDLLANNNRYF